MLTTSNHIIEILLPDTTAHTVNYQIQRKNNTRAIRLYLYPQAPVIKLKITAPHFTPLNTITEFISDKKTWIAKHLFLSPKIKNVIDFSLTWPSEVSANAKLPFQGKIYTIELEEVGKNRLTPPVLLSPPNFIIRHSDYIIDNLITWYQEQARAIIDKTVQAFCPLLGLWPNNITLKQQKSRWGSCGVHNDIHINWLLIIAPPIVLEYVIIHELAHLKYRSHSQRFWKLVEKLFPLYTVAEGWLKKYGRYLKPPTWPAAPNLLSSLIKENLTEKNNSS